MVISLQEYELLSVSGGDFFKNFFGSLAQPFTSNNMACMGDDGGHPTTCYDYNGAAVCGWDAGSWDCAVWFCCSGDKGEYYGVAVGKEYQHCKTRARTTLKTSNPQNLAGQL